MGDHFPGLRHVYFRLPSVAEKRCIPKLPVFMDKKSRGTEFSMLDRSKTKCADATFTLPITPMLECSFAQVLLPKVLSRKHKPFSSPISVCQHLWLSRLHLETKQTDVVEKAKRCVDMMRHETSLHRVFTLTD